MLSFQEIQEIIDQCQCEPWEFRFSCVQCVRTSSWRDLAPCQNPEHTWFVQAVLWRKDTDSGEFGYGFGSKRFVSPHSTPGEIIKSCFVVARDYAEHEVREAFQWKGRRILGPHLDVNKLWDVAEELEVREPQNGSVQTA